MNTLDSEYQKIIQKILNTGIEETNKRTKHKTKILPGITFEIYPKDGFPILTIRKIPFKIFIAEQIWFLTGSRKPSDLLSEYTKIWDDFTSLDGTVSTAYGYRWRQHFGRDQINLLVNHLKEDPSSRHGVVVTWDPALDGLSTKVVKANVPCPYTFTVNITQNQLNLHNIVRSNDMILGFPHDVSGFALLQRILAAKLNCSLGKYTHSISHAHIYETHFEASKEILKRKNKFKPFEINIPKNAFDRAQKGDKKLINELISQFEENYQYLEPIKGLKVVL